MFEVSIRVTKLLTTNSFFLLFPINFSYNRKKFRKSNRKSDWQFFFFINFLELFSYIDYFF